MSLGHSPSIVTSGLVLALDAANFKSYDYRENLVAYSTYNASAWSNPLGATGTITTGISAPDGTNTAIRYTFSNTGNAILRVAVPAFTPNGTDTYTTSFYVRKISGTGTLSTDLQDGNPSKNYNSELITNEWVRVVTSGIPTATSKTFIDLISDVNTNYVLDFWGVQLEKSSTASTYTGTSGSTVTRSTTWTDLSGNANTGTLVNGPTFSSLNQGSLVFDSTNDHITVNSSATIPTGAAARTISIWFSTNTTTWAADVNNLFFHGAGATGQAFGIDFSTYPSMEFYTWGGVGRDLTFSTTFAQTGWKNITVTYNGTTTILIYENGIQTQTLTLSAACSTASSTMYIGALNPSVIAGYYFDGNISQVSMYNVALTANQVKQNFNALRGRYSI